MWILISTRFKNINWIHRHLERWIHLPNPNPPNVRGHPDTRGIVCQYSVSYEPISNDLKLVCDLSNTFMCYSTHTKYNFQWLKALCTKATQYTLICTSRDKIGQLSQGLIQDLQQWGANQKLLLFFCCCLKQKQFWHSSLNSWEAMMKLRPEILIALFALLPCCTGFSIHHPELTDVCFLFCSIDLFHRLQWICVFWTLLLITDQFLLIFLIHLTFYFIDIFHRRGLEWICVCWQLLWALLQWTVYCGDTVDCKKSYLLNENNS